MKELWPRFLGGAIVLFACFFGALIALTPHYSLWALLAVVGVCITGAIGVTGAVYGLVNARVLARKRDALGEDDLKKSPRSVPSLDAHGRKNGCPFRHILRNGS
jgi:hypothetical protein